MPRQEAPAVFPVPHAGEALLISGGSMLAYLADRDPNMLGKAAPFDRHWDWTMGSRATQPLTEIQQQAVDLRCDAFVWERRMYLTLRMTPVNVAPEVRVTYCLPPPIVV